MSTQEYIVKELLLHRSILFGYILGITADFHLAEDLYQEVSMTAFKKAGSFTQGTNFRAWIFEIARRKLLEQQRQVSRQGLPLNKKTLEKIEDSFSRYENRWEQEREALSHCVEELSETSRSVLHMRYEESLKLDEIGKKIKKPSGTVQVALSRIRAKLRSCIEAFLRREQSE
jgi:RNA polymerase sigma-70 factor (ECF subfamily)